jgi:hypothetical protein
MPKFNRILSALEAVHSIAPPVVENVDPLYVSDFIHYAFENASDFGINGFEKDWFCEYNAKLPKKAISFIGGLLEEKGHIISRKALTEGIHIFSKEEIDELT